MLKIGILHVTGYGGSELVRILHEHPEVQIKSITGRSNAGKKIVDTLSNINLNILKRLNYK